jgi:hypothetical protein
MYMRSINVGKIFAFSAVILITLFGWSLARAIDYTVSKAIPQTVIMYIVAFILLIGILVVWGVG